MYWYNPTTRTSERAQAPSTDEQAIRMLDGHPDSATFVSEYAKLRRSGTPIERALVLVGHEERLRLLDRMPVRLAEREEPPSRSRRRRRVGIAETVALLDEALDEATTRDRCPRTS